MGDKVDVLCTILQCDVNMQSMIRLYLKKKTSIINDLLSKFRVNLN